MRLINTRTFQLKEYWSEENLQYAILSHRWEDDEVDFQDIQQIQGLDREQIHASELRQKKGFAKIELSCLQAVHDGFELVWVDTCCIDKNSSAELTEAINSMYRWYQHASVCYAYLSDVNCHIPNAGDEKPTAVKGSFAASTWFTRGWTLQELVAPKNVVFYDQSWEWLGTKQSLSANIARITGIDEDILAGEDILERSIAQRMSWAASRTTTRVEDIAYSLLGIFDVNMPLLYGEGSKAFLRLQEEIIRRLDDHSIFAWPQEDPTEPGLLARSPAAFKGCRHVRSVGSRKGRSAYSMTNRGLSITLDAIPWCVDTYAVALQCVDEASRNDKEKPIEEQRMCMFVRRLDEDDQFIRVKYGGKTFSHAEAAIWETNAADHSTRGTRPVRKLEMNVRQTLGASQVDGFRERVNGFRINTPALLEKDKKGRDLFKVDAPTWNEEHAIMSMVPGRFGTVGSIDISDQKRKIKVIKLGFDFDYNPVCFIAESGGLTMKTHALDRQGNLNWNQDWQWNEKEQAEFKSIHQRSCFDTMAWSTISGGAAAQLTGHSGLWAIKGDRVNGLSVRILNYDVGEPTTLDITRGEFEDRLIWDVKVGGIKDRMTRNLHPGLPSKKPSETAAKSEDTSVTPKSSSGFKIFKSK